jgi:polyphosphate kinase 2 (PPK2 family)
VGQFSVGINKRIDDPNKNWKFSTADIQERKFWPQYMTAYEQCLSATSTTDSPWYVVPADDKNNTRVIVSQIVLETLDAMNLAYPKANAARLKELKAIRAGLAP